MVSFMQSVAHALFEIFIPIQTGGFDRKIIKFKERSRGTVSFNVINNHCNSKDIPFHGFFNF